jgi:hypothetical protein
MQNLPVGLTKTLLVQFFVKVNPDNENHPMGKIFFNVSV